MSAQAIGTRPAVSAWAAALWLSAFCAALAADVPLARAVRRSGVEAAAKEPGIVHTIARNVKRAGNYANIVIVAALVCAVHPVRWRACLLTALTGPVALGNSLLKWVIGRPRPPQPPSDICWQSAWAVEPFRGGLGGLFQDSNLAFPSGHTAVAFAAATALAALYPRAAVAFYAAAALVAVERVAENAHYASDVVAAAALATMCMRLIARVWKGPVEAAGGKQ